MVSMAACDMCISIETQDYTVTATATNGVDTNSVTFISILFSECRTRCERLTQNFTVTHFIVCKHLRDNSTALRFIRVVKLNAK